MANNVFANNREISCKSGSGNTICAFPDTCFTPPENPATPPGVPIPYPNTGKDSDTTDGTKHVKITGKEVMLKNKSYFKTSYGDEAGAAAKKGVITSVNRGKVYFNAWSMDVKFEGENVVRHLDLTTHNHASFPGNSPTWPFLDSMAFAGSGPCKDVAKEVESKCLKEEPDGKGGTQLKHVFVTGKDEVKRKESIESMCADAGCRKALKCVLSPKSPSNCCPQPQPSPPKTTPHHIVPDSQFYKKAGGSERVDFINPKAEYSYNAAPCICAEGISHSVGKHGQMHSKTNKKTRAAMGVPSGKTIPDDKRWSVGQAESVGAEAVSEVTGCDKDCIEHQVRNGHKAMNIRKDDKCRPTTAGGE